MQAFLKIGKTSTKDRSKTDAPQEAKLRPKPWVEK